LLHPVIRLFPENEYSLYSPCPQSQSIAGTHNFRRGGTKLQIRNLEVPTDLFPKETRLSSNYSPLDEQAKHTFYRD